jgi:hypothetical protein
VWPTRSRRLTIKAAGPAIGAEEEHGNVISMSLLDPDDVADPVHFRDLPSPVRGPNDIADLASDGVGAIIAYDINRFDGWTLDQITTALRGTTLQMLKRGTMSALIARREWGGMLVAVCKLLTSDRDQTSLFQRLAGLDYSDARRHMKLWVFWPRVEKMLLDCAESCCKRGVPFIVPGYRRCLEMAGISGRMAPAIPCVPPPPPPSRNPGEA